MYSKVVYTEEAEDMSVAAAEILDQMKDFELKKNSIAVFYVAEVINYSELYAELKKAWDFPIVGCTAMGIIINDFYNYGISAMVMTADDVTFAAGVTGEVTPENYSEEIDSLYKKLSAELGETEKMTLAYGVSTMDGPYVSGDEFMFATNDAVNKRPIFGGLASDNLSYVSARVFFNDNVVKCGEALVLIGGNVEPKFIHVNSVEKRDMLPHVITKANGSFVYELDGEPLVDVLKRDHFYVGKEDVIDEYMQTPFLITMDFPDGGQATVVRSLSTLNFEDGSGMFLGQVFEGARLEYGSVSREGVQSSLKKVMHRMIDRVNESPVEYHTVFCVSCASRFLIMSSMIEDEVKTWVPELPEGISYLGMYSFGEFCPVYDAEDGTGYNAFHNFTYTMVAL